MVNLQSSVSQATPEQREKLAALKADPELKLVFDDIESNGPGMTMNCLIMPVLDIYESGIFRSVSVMYSKVSSASLPMT